MYKALFEKAGLDLIREEFQKDFPKVYYYE
jgi:hypothetical protein